MNKTRTLLIFCTFLWWCLALARAEAKTYNVSREDVLEALSQCRTNMLLDKTASPAEADAKSDLLNQIILETDIHFQGGDYKRFLATTMDQLIEINSKSENRLGIDLRDYLSSLRDSIQEDMEPSENPALFLTHFLFFNSILDQVGDSGMNSAHAYSNGREWNNVKGKSLEEAGHWASTQIDQKKIEPDVFPTRIEKLSDDTQMILSNGIGTRPSDSANESPGIIQWTESGSPNDWILQNSNNPY